LGIGIRKTAIQVANRSVRYVGCYWGCRTCIVDGPGKFSSPYMDSAPTVQAFASAWDEQEHRIRAAKIAGVMMVQIPPLPATSQDSRGRRYFGLRLMDSISDNWVNKCAADYYGVGLIIAQ